VATLRSETIVALYALIELGAPIVLLHPRLTPVEREDLVGTAGASLVLDEAWSDADLPEATFGEGAAPRTHDPEAAMALLFTSGSTGTPKGVVLSRRAFVAAAAASAANVGWRADDRWLLCMPIAHVGGLSVIVRCLVARVPVVLSPWAGSVEGLLADICRKRATILSLVPTMLSRILEEAPARPLPDHVRAVFVGGDAARPKLLHAAAERGVRVLTTYGLTEACSQVATQVYGEPASLDGAVGPPLQGVEVRIVNGEIQVRGPNLLSAYFPSDRFPSPFVDDGWLPTGDQGELDSDGRLRVQGRRSDLIITGGENVDPAEVERALSSCPGVRDVCVFGVADAKWGQIVAAAIVASDTDERRILGSLVSHVRERLAAHKQPRMVAFCQSIVLNATGKVDRRATAAAVNSALASLPR
jgi:O-succinylbenzoic acid--CoA ligase